MAWCYECTTTGAEMDTNQWIPLNKIRTGHKRCSDWLYKWDTARSPECDCSARKQTIREECSMRSEKCACSDFAVAVEPPLKWIRNIETFLFHIACIAIKIKNCTKTTKKGKRNIFSIIYFFKLSYSHYIYKM